MGRDLSGTDEPVLDWEFGGSSYRLSIVGGLLRMEQRLLGGGWYLVEPNYEAAAMMVCADELLRRLREAEQAIVRLRYARSKEAQP